MFNNSFFNWNEQDNICFHNNNSEDNVDVDKIQHITLIEKNGWFNTGITYDRFMDVYGDVDTEKPLKVIIKTYGKNLSTFLLIARVLSRHKGKTTAVIDRYAYSGGTILALVCDEIVMTEYSILGGINPHYIIPINARHIIKKALRYVDFDSHSNNQNSIWMQVLCEYYLDTEKSVTQQLESLLQKKYTYDQTLDIIKFFVTEVDHNRPLYYDMLPKFVCKKVTLDTTSSKQINNQISSIVQENNEQTIETRNKYINDHDSVSDALSNSVSDGESTSSSDIIVDYH